MNHDTPDTLPPSDNDPEPTRLTSAAAGPGTTFGPYLLRERIGVGGMGEVWKAEQSAPIRRTVALKLIKAGMDSSEVLARFEVERQALALMDHPCIAKVYDAGTTPQGRPYFAMEYVQGVPINEYCDKRRLGMRQRLELFQRVCQGVQHAHQKAVLHRDLKPTNVLVTDVDGVPTPKIIDFGVAKAMTRKLTDTTMHTALGQLIGTPEYMSPEQAELTKEDVDTRTDVYSLGAILYELLVGALPFDAKELRQAGFEGILRKLREEDPPRPSTRLSSLGERSTAVAQSRRTEPGRLSSQLRGDLDWIVMRALEKDRNRRYGSPAEFAQDIQRHLDQEPVLAGPPTARYRASKFVQRHRAGVSVASVAVLALAAFAVVSTVQARTIARERDRAEDEAAKSAAMNEFLGEMLTSADPWRGGNREVTVVAALDAAVKEIDTAFAGQPEVEASMRSVLGQTYLGLGKIEPARVQIERAVQMHGELSSTDSREYGVLRTTEAKLRQANAEYDAAVESATEAARAFRLDPDSTPGDLMNAHQYVARNLLYARRFDEAESVITRTEQLVPRLEGPQRILAAEVLSQRADLYFQRDGNIAAADSLTRLAFERAMAIDPEHAVLPTYRNNAAQYRSQRGDLEGALADFDAALALFEKRFGTDHPEYATGLENRGGVLYRLGRVDECFASLERVRDIRQRNLGPDHIDVVRTGLNMGTVASLAGNHERALEIFGELEPILIEARGPDHEDVVVVLRNKGGALRSLGRHDEARAAFGQAEETAERTLGPDHPQTARMRVAHATSLIVAERYAEAEARLLAAFEVLSAREGPQHVATRETATILSKLYETLGREDEAERFRELAKDE